MCNTGLHDLEYRDISDVSGGQPQRACICQAMINEPKILFSDEPTGALNSKSSEEVMELFLDINKKGTLILFVIHDSKVACRAERVVFIKDDMIQLELSLGKFCKKDLEDQMNQVLKQMREVGI